MGENIRGDKPRLSQWALDKGEIICFRCGMCCRYGVCLSSEEAETIYCYTGLLLSVFLERIELKQRDEPVSEDGFKFSGDYNEPYWLEPPFFHILTRNGACFFLEPLTGTKETRCLIHAVKPVSCQTYSSGLSREWCREGLAEYWQLTVNSSGELVGTPERLKDFRLFLDSLKTD